MKLYNSAEHCVIEQQGSGESSKPLERIVMFERKTNKLVTGPAAPTESTLLSWLLRHPSFEVVQPTHQAPPPSMIQFSSCDFSRHHCKTSVIFKAHLRDCKFEFDI